MNEKTERIIGMGVFAFLVTFALWYVDYDHIRVVEFFGQNSGFHSVADQVLSGIFRNEYWRGPRLWVVTQVIPLLLSWRIRRYLGAVVGYVIRLV